MTHAAPMSCRIHMRTLYHILTFLSAILLTPSDGATRLDMAQGTVDLATGVTGVTPTSNGGTGTTFAMQAQIDQIDAVLNDVAALP
mgnify:FL=1